MQAQLPKLLWAAVITLSLTITTTAEPLERRTYSYHSFTPTLWASQPTAAPPFPFSSTSNTSNPIPYKLQTPPLDTPWTAKVGLHPWPEHPRPQLRRDRWTSLNGLWTWQPVGADNNSAVPATLPTAPLQYETLVPSCIEGAISGLQDLNATSMWYATQFAVPADWGRQQQQQNSSRVLLHFEAVDYMSTVFINGRQAGQFTGGYFRNTIDATAFLHSNGTMNDLKVFVFDPTDLADYIIPIGKQTRRPEHIFYRPCSGIWQTVWLESAPATYISQLDVNGAADGSLTVKAHTNGSSTSNSSQQVKVEVHGPDGSVVGTGSGSSGAAFTFNVDGVDQWSPDAPNLYNLTVTLGEDTVSSYTGFRTIEKGEVDGVQRPMLNGEFVFQWGTLDQGYWPDGIYLPPTYEAMVFDLLELKKLGFNTVRKHIKVEPDLFYWATDSLGLMVIQDMPSMSPRVPAPSPEQQAEFERQFDVLINEHLSYPSIVTWVIYNEGWGQLRDRPPYPEEAIANRINQIDGGTRLINAVTGWFDHGFGDYSDNHHYASPQCGTPYYSIQSSQYDRERIGFQGEFGGLGHNVSIEHLWNVQEAIDTINQTYEINEDLAAYNYRSHVLFDEFRQQIELFGCSGGIYTQTTDVEGEVNGLLTYDRRIERPDVEQWQADIQSFYTAAASRGGFGNSTAAMKMF